MPSSTRSRSQASTGAMLVQSVLHLHELRALMAGLAVLVPEAEGTRTQLELRRCIREEEQRAEDLLYALCSRCPPGMRAA